MLKNKYLLLYVTRDLLIIDAVVQNVLLRFDLAENRTWAFAKPLVSIYVGIN